MTRRQQKVSSLILRELSRIINQKIADPRISWVNIIEVNISADLQQARVYYSTIEENASIEETQKGLESATPFIKKELQKVVKLRKLPTLTFIYDESIKIGDKLIGLLQNLNPLQPKD